MKKQNRPIYISTFCKTIFVFFNWVIIIFGTYCNQHNAGDTEINKIKIKYDDRYRTSQFDLNCDYLEDAFATRVDSLIISDLKQIKEVVECINKSKPDPNIKGIDARAKIYMYKNQELKSVYCIDGGQTIVINDESYLVNICINDLIYQIIEKNKL